MKDRFSAERWKQISELLDAVLDLPAGDRRAYVERACGDDSGLRTEVEALLAADRDAGSFLEAAGGPQAGTLSLESSASATGAGDAWPDRDANLVAGGWKLLRPLGEGGMGVVYLAERAGGGLRQTAALKLIRRGMDSGQVIARFEAERQALALMSHPAIAAVYDAGTTDDGRPFFAMEYVEGVPITRFCDAERLGTRQRLELFLQLCDGVQHAHQKAIIHRDLKPSNVLVRVRDGRPAVTIIDFGIAKALAQRLTERTLYTEAGMMLGTPAYMSPEQAALRHQEVDTRSDVYSLGAMLYELLVGTRPFDLGDAGDTDSDEMRRRIREVDPPRPSARLAALGERAREIAARRRADPRALRREFQGDLDRIVMRALEKDPARRYGSPSDFAADIRRHLRHEPVLAHAPSKAYLVRKFVRRHRLGVIAAGVMVAGLTAGLIGTTIGLRRALLAERRATREAEAKGQVAQFLENLFKISDPGVSRGSSVTARELLDRAVATIDPQMAGQPEVQADMLEIMGLSYAGLGLQDPYLDLERRAADIRTRVLGPEHPATLKARHNEARALWIQGRFADAERLLLETQGIRKRTLGPDHPDTLSGEVNLAAIYLQAERQTEAERLLLEALPQLRKTLGPEDDSTLACIGNLAMLYQTTGRTAQAEPYAREILDAWRHTLGEDHPRTLAAMGTLGRVEESEGHLPEAEQLFEEALAANTRVFGADHGRTLTAMNDLAGIYISEKRYPESERLYRQVLASRQRLLGARHVDTLATMVDLGCLAAVQGDRHAALLWLRQAVDLGYMGADSLARDEDLASLHGPELDALVERARRNAAAVRADAAPAGG
jgi:non-specific serine/threonine protein kinase/serine/threonine-protein kinase